MYIFTINDKQEQKFLAKKTVSTDSTTIKTKEVSELIKEMKTTMRQADGIGLSANQVGINMKLFVAQVTTDQTAKSKFYVIFNPEIIKVSEETSRLEEGCLSVPENFGLVERPEKITIAGLDRRGKKIKLRAWGMLARVFQHEVDHLNGHLFIEKAEGIHQIKKQK